MIVNYTLLMTIIEKVNSIIIPKKQVKGKIIKPEIKVELTEEEKFILSSSKLYNEKYDYSLIKFKDLNTPIKVICPEHGLFKIIPQDHLNGSSCPTCRRYNMGKY